MLLYDENTTTPLYFDRANLKIWQRLAEEQQQKEVIQETEEEEGAQTNFPTQKSLIDVHTDSTLSDF